MKRDLPYILDTRSLLSKSPDEQKVMPGKGKIDFDFSAIDWLNRAEVNALRRGLLRVIPGLRDRGLRINFDTVRLHSIKNDTLLIAPQRLELEIISACNYRCSFCLTHGPLVKEKWQLRKDAFMNFKDIKKIILQAYTMGTETIFITGKGEPLLHPNIAEIISEAAGRGMEVLLITNASIPAAIDEILRLSAHYRIQFFINLSAATADAFKRVHGAGGEEFAHLLNNIYRINKKYPAVLSFIIGKYNMDEIFKFVDLSAKLGVKSVNFKYPSLWRSKDRKIMLSKDQQALFAGRLSQVIAYAKRRGVNVRMERVSSDLPGWNDEHAKALSCYSGWFSQRVRLDGKMYICCWQNKAIARLTKGDWKKALFSKKCVSLLLEGKNRLDITKARWSRCARCINYERNVNTQEMLS